MKRLLLTISALGLLCAVGAAAGDASAQRRGRARPRPVCGDPTVRCRTTAVFQPHQLPFEVSASDVIVESEPFYIIILKSVRDTAQDGTVFVPEDERLEAQKLFPRHKVFASRGYEPDELYYEGTAEGQQFMAVFAGRTRAEAGRVLARVRATGKFPGANLRRTRTGFNGT